MGELPAFYARAAVAIVGGGFADYGGHNPFEPLQAGVPVLFGPNMRHFASESMALTAVLPEAQVSGTDALGEQLARWLSDESSRTSALAAQRSVLPDPSVLGQRYRDLLSPWFERFGAKPESPPIL
jgi:3-deoxy-D-manno-octulosonic-acid transferase